jgi:hypothetical protein
MDKAGTILPPINKTTTPAQLNTPHQVLHSQTLQLMKTRGSNASRNKKTLRTMDLTNTEVSLEPARSVIIFMIHNVIAVIAAIIAVLPA